MISIKKLLTEAYSFELDGGNVKGTGDKWPNITVLVEPDMVTISQKMGGRTSKVLLSKKQFKDLREAKL